MCIVYVGVKQKTPFPSTIMETVRKKYYSLKELHSRDAKSRYGIFDDLVKYLLQFKGLKMEEFLVLALL
jgi:hypothetical protein